MATITKRGSSYKITVSNGYDVHGKQIRTSMTWTPPTGMTARQIDKEVNRQAVLFEEKVKARTVTVDGNIRFYVFAEKFLDEYARPCLKATTVRNYERDIARINNSAIGNMKLNAIKPTHITRFYTSLTKEGANLATGDALSSATIGAINRTMSAVLSKAVKWKYIPSNPAKQADRPKVVSKEARYLDEPDARRMLMLLQDAPIKWRSMIIFDLFSGLRRGELLGLQWDDVDFDRRTLTVRNTLNYVPKKGVYIDTPKSARSHRPLHLSGTAIALLLEQRQWQEERRKLLGDAWNETGYIFCLDDGNHPFPTSLTTWFRKWIRKTDLPYVTIHSLRHTFASLQISDGVPLIVVSRQLGHAKTSTTANIYAHMLAQSEAQADKTFDKFADVIGNKHQTNTKPKPERKTSNF